MKKTTLLILTVIILCTVCAAQAEGNGLPVFASIQDVLDSTTGELIVQDHKDNIVLLMELDGKYLRMVTLLDDHAKDLYKPMEAEDHSVTDIKTFEAYAWALPLSYIEELPDVPKSQTELDDLKGKTVQELQDQGFGIIILPQNYEENPDVINLEYGSYKYEFEVTNGASGYPQFMTIKSGKLIGFSYAAFHIDNP